MREETKEDLVLALDVTMQTHTVALPLHEQTTRRGDTLEKKIIQGVETEHFITSKQAVLPISEPLFI